MSDPNPGTVVAVAGAKGGVGKTTTTLNLAAALAERDVSVVAVELDLAMANVVEFLDFDEAPDPTVHDVLAGEASTSEALCEREAGYDVVPCGIDLEGFAATNLDRLPDLLASLRTSYDVILLDMGAGASHETIEPLKRADYGLLVATPRTAALRDAGKTERLIEAVGTDVAGVLVARATPDAEPGQATVAEYVATDLLGHVAEDEAVPAAQDAGQPVVLAAPDRPAAVAYRAAAGRLLDVVAPGLDADASAPPLADTLPSELVADPAPPHDGPRPAAGPRATDDGTARSAAVSDGGVAAETSQPREPGAPAGPTPDSAERRPETSSDAAPETKETVVEPSPDPEARETVIDPSSDPEARETVVEPSSDPETRETVVDPPSGAGGSTEDDGDSRTAPSTDDSTDGDSTDDGSSLLGRLLPFLG